VQTTHRIIRHDKGFVQIANEVVRDRRLSFCARGILAMVLSHTDGWKTSQRWLAEQTEYEGLTVVRNALKQLERCGSGSVSMYSSVSSAGILRWPNGMPAPPDSSNQDESNWCRRCCMDRIGVGWAVDLSARRERMVFFWIR